METNKEYFYRKAIEFLGATTDYKELCFRLASTIPEAFVNTFALDDEALKERVLREFDTLGFIPAIKFHRSVTKWGLKESKDWVELLLKDNSYSRDNSLRTWNKVR